MATMLIMAMVAEVEGEEGMATWGGGFSSHRSSGGSYSSGTSDGTMVVVVVVTLSNGGDCHAVMAVVTATVVGQRRESDKGRAVNWWCDPADI